MVSLLITAAGLRGGLHSSPMATMQREVDSRRDTIEYLVVLLTTGRVPIGHSSSSHCECRQQQHKPWTGRPWNADGVDGPDGDQRSKHGFVSFVV